MDVLQDDVTEEVLKICGDKLRNLILYGSYTRIEQDPESDFDIMILVDESEESLGNYRYVISDVMGELTIKQGKLISLTEMTYCHFKDYLKVLPLYKRGRD